MLSLDEARGLVAERADNRLVGSQNPAAESVALGAAHGRRLAENLHADGPWPSTDRSAMDGFAVCAGPDGVPAGSVLPVVGESLAGHPFAGTAGPGQAIRIMTGAVVPAPFDAVVPVEDTDGYEGQTVNIRPAVAPGANVRPLGSEVGAGDLLIPRGTRLRAAEIGALAVLGRHEVSVFRRPRVAILSTGDEVVDVHVAPEPHQVRDSNSHALAAQVLELGGEPLRLGVGRDDAADLEERIGRGLREADVLLTIGGVSKGTHDLVHRAFETQGVERVFHGVRLKPGKPSYFGEQADGAFVFGLPGNPASCFTVFDLLVRPLLLRLAGAPAAAAYPELAQVAVGGAPGRSNRREQAVPARLEFDGESRAIAHLLAVQPSGDPFGLLGATGYGLVPAERAPADAGRIAYVPFGVQL